MKLFPHQIEALKATEGKNRVAFYLDMGLGKTFLGAEKAVQMDSGLILVVCQKSKVQDWVDHFTKHYPQMTVRDLTEKGAVNDLMSWYTAWFGWHGANNAVGVINYDLIWRRQQLLQLKNFTLILDESSLIQNPQSKRCKFILKMEPDNVVLLSGTPTGGKYENLWSQIHLLGWDISESLYASHYVNWKKIFIGMVPHKVVDKDNPYKNVERLKQKMRDHGAVFMKTEEVFELPEQTFIQIDVPTTKEYRKFKRDHLITIDDVELVGDSILSYRLYQRQLCSAYNPHKIQAFQDLMESTQDRLIVFYQFNAELEALQKVCDSLKRPFSVVNGTVKNLKAYEEESDSVTFVQYQAGAMGLNLQKANKIVYFGLTEESELFEQSKKRIHRINQTRPCFYYLLICKNSIEDQEILPTLDVKKERTDELFEERE